MMTDEEMVWLTGIIERTRRGDIFSEAEWDAFDERQRELLGNLTQAVIDVVEAKERILAFLRSEDGQ